MTAEDVHRQADAVILASFDDKAAHEAEDKLHRSVLRAIAAGADDPVGLASEALRPASLEFQRRCV